MKRMAVLSASVVLSRVAVAADTEQHAEKKPKEMISYALIRVVAASESGLANQDLIRVLLTRDDIIRGAIANAVPLPRDDKALEAIRGHVSFWEQKQPNSELLPPVLPCSTSLADRSTSEFSRTSFCRRLARNCRIC